MFKKNLNATLEALGFADKAKKNELTKGDWKKIAAKYKEMHGPDMYEAIHAEQEQDSERDEEHQAALTILNAIDNADESKDGSLADKVSNLANQLKASQEENTELKKTMKSTTLPDDSKTLNVITSLNGRGHTESHAFGIEHDMFSTTKRWNKVTVNPGYAKLSDSTDEDEKTFYTEVSSYGKKVCDRITDLFGKDQLKLNAQKGLDVDYSGLTGAGLGDQYVIQRTDAIIAQILQLESVDNLFPIRWGIQDRELLTNAFMGEFSQGYQEGQVFKGNMSLNPELGHVDDAMFKTNFHSYKWLERTYLGAKNTSGSAAVKWGMIEWTALNIITVLYNEQYERNVRGIFVKPVPDVPGSYLNAATGLVYTLVRYVHENKLLPMDDASYSDYDETGTVMVDAAKALVADLKAKNVNLKGFTVYLNSNHQDWWKEACRRKYGKDIDFNGTSSYLNQMPDSNLPILWVPNLENIKLMMLQKSGNLQRLGFVPGEMVAMKFQEFMENVLSWSMWKEGFSATYVGKPFNSMETLKANKYKDQQVFINKPCTSLVPDATEIDGENGFWFVTGKNTAPVENADNVNITDIINAQNGVAYVIECGTVEHAPTIKKTGTFDGILSDFIPTQEGDYLMVIKRKVSDSEEKIQELERCVNGIRVINKLLQPNIPGAR